MLAYVSSVIDLCLANTMKMIVITMAAAWAFSSVSSAPHLENAHVEDQWIESRSLLDNYQTSVKLEQVNAAEWLAEDASTPTKRLRLVDIEKTSLPPDTLVGPDPAVTAYKAQVQESADVNSSNEEQEWTKQNTKKMHLFIFAGIVGTVLTVTLFCCWCCGALSRNIKK